MSGHFWMSGLEGEGGMLLASSGWRLGVLLNILQSVPKCQLVPRLKIPAYTGMKINLFPILKPGTHYPNQV